MPRKKRTLAERIAHTRLELEGARRAQENNAKRIERLASTLRDLEAEARGAALAASLIEDGPDD